MAACVARAQVASGLERIEVLEHVGEFIRWCYERDAARQSDLVLHLAQNELLKRDHGASPRTLSLPSAPHDAALDHDGVIGVVTSWEIQSYAGALLEPSDGPHDADMVFFGVLGVVLFLTERDGVPVRLEQLDPDTFCADLLAAPTDLGGLPRPGGYLRTMLEGAAELYRRVARRETIARDLAQSIASRLDALAILAEAQREFASA